MSEQGFLMDKNDYELEKKGSRFILILTVICLLMHTIFFFLFANKTEPFVMGLPFSLFWHVLWICVNLVSCIVAYRLEFKGR